MQNNRFWQGVKRAYVRYDHMMEKQGFYVVLSVCVLVIVLSAFYTFRLRDEAEEPSLSARQEEAQSVGGAQDAQTLAEAEALVKSQGAKEALSVPTQAPFVFTQPVSGFTERGYSDTKPQFFSQSNTWQVHPGIDLQTDFGTAVLACASGTVLGVWEDNELGLCVRVSHANGYESLYAGLSNAGYVKKGDSVMQGQCLGHVGNGVLAESDAKPHLHLEIWRNGRPVDPMSVFLGVDN
ncbi:MAG: M23 family metallopeptidase [Clostridia bacterium]